MSFKKLHDSVFNAAVDKIKDLLIEKGVESKHSNTIVLLVPDEQMFNLEGGRYLTEITAEELIDNEGYRYDLFVLNLEQLCEVVDAISNEENNDSYIIRINKEEQSGMMQLINYVIDKRVCNKASSLSYLELISLKNKLFKV